MTGHGIRQCHVPVLLKEVLEGLQVRQAGLYLDGTVGEGGHALEILRGHPETRVIGLDRDPQALASAGRRLEGFGDRVVLLRRDFRDMGAVAGELGIDGLDGILLDLGVSSLQLDTGERGFSFSFDGPLDMRMDPQASLTAEEVVNTFSEADLKRIISRYGEDRLAGRIARAIVRGRMKEPIKTTGRLARIVSEVPGMGRVRNIHPATRTFQALRIEVNDELGAVQEALPAGVDLLVDGGRMAVISFHSLEDRIVKRTFRKMENPCECPSDLPMCVCGPQSLGRVITRKPVKPGDEEQVANPRSRSARLRIFERRAEKENG